MRDSATLLSVLLRNLADNALSYGGNGVRVVVALAREDGGSGPGWSNVRRIAAVHRAQVETARADALGGLAVRVRFPA